MNNIIIGTIFSCPDENRYYTIIPSGNSAPFSSIAITKDKFLVEVGLGEAVQMRFTENLEFVIDVNSYVKGGPLHE